MNNKDLAIEIVKVSGSDRKQNIVDLEKKGFKAVKDGHDTTIYKDGQKVAKMDALRKAAGVKVKRIATTEKTTTEKRTTAKRTITKSAAVKILQQRVIVSRLVTEYYVSDKTKAAAVELANKRKQARRLESAMNQYNEQIKAKAAAKQAAAAKKQAAATVASDDDLIIKVMADRAAAGDTAAAAYLESINKLSEERKASEKTAAKETAAKVTKKGRGKKTA